jgi:xanthine dehydrogenase accessory factor
VYEIAADVARWQAAGRPVTVARVVAIRGLSSRERCDVVAATPGAPMTGTVLSGAVDEQLTALLAEGGPSRMVELRVADAAARDVGMSCGGTARLHIAAATEFPADLWARLAAREPLCLVTRCDGDTVGATHLLTRSSAAGAGPQVAQLFGAGVSQTAILDDLVVTALWPVPRLLIVGAGQVADALVSIAVLLGWAATVVNDADSATTEISNLAEPDGVVVLSHDRDVDGPALLAALSARAGYLGAMGSRRTQDARAQWLADHGVSDLGPLHGPAGLDIGANTPPEIGLAIFAEILATRSGATAGSLRDRGGPIHGSASSGASHPTRSGRPAR